jgi:clan AA aspartic protease (TIGR02281 family)
MARNVAARRPRFAVFNILALILLVAAFGFRDEILFHAGTTGSATTVTRANAQTAPAAPATMPSEGGAVAPLAVLPRPVSPPVVSPPPAMFPPAVYSPTAQSTPGVVPMAAQPPVVISPSAARQPEVERPRARPDSFSAVARRESNGHFYFDTVADGIHLRMVFDTGASIVSLRSEDAARLGIDVARLNYSIVLNTANGTTSAAPVTIATMSIGNISLRNVRAVVAQPGKLSANLLGQSFLARVAGYSVEGNQLVLKGGE